MSCALYCHAGLINDIAGVGNCHADRVIDQAHLAQAFTDAGAKRGNDTATFDDNITQIALRLFRYDRQVQISNCFTGAGYCVTG
ncbi:hypothetical protein D3C73_1526230 [compost metagenome]